ncbi:right-handed parallel beta-helix repeat-containing protein [Bifidobacterium sp. LC6]|uniref:Right-handed parallel beta-helix repeat-containing protein n=1 Tax=Bifidobacterium colobi TaxID=2809026 RepID=A0ABS5UTF2_9BIFI|nr:right-handed parallel beta-helix repeat-containing protein [Bifidobacterium colobi]MBT1174269.1 right-handed parallel beta-helix repeat-containing protein [Bifidobacterium colobi]
MTQHTLHVSAAALGAAVQNGDETTPFATISAAAAVAMPGDTVLVHEGIYREQVSPALGGLNEFTRITYAAASGEYAVIKGSEIVTGWEPVGGADRSKGAEGVWHVSVPNALFGDFNPFATPLRGDWLERPSEWTMSLGEVYLDGRSMYEAPSVEAVAAAEPRTFGYGPDWVSVTEPIEDPSKTIWQWHAEVRGGKEGTTEIWANFHDLNPNEHLTEINVRETCFYPKLPGRNYITVRGFELAQAACGWAPPTGNQKGLIGTHWSKGWIIEDNDIHDARCSGVSLGKDETTGDNEASRFGRKPGYQIQQEVVFRAIRHGWSRETIGGHIVRRNHIHDCGQNGIVGHMGCAFSIIEDNHIHNIATKREFFGHEIAGIKFHAAIDTVIRHNHIHDCTLGTWLDWELQGTRVTRNIYHNNWRDFMIEVTSGPCLFDNNIFGSFYSMDNVAQGSAFVHNLFCGTTQPRTVLNRSTPYHLPHSTAVAGYACVYGGDDRFYQNIFVGGPEFSAVTHRGTAYADGAPTSEAEYMARVHANDPGDVEMFEQVPQPMYINGNAYLRGGEGQVAPAFAAEQTKYVATASADAGARVAAEPVGAEGVAAASALAAKAQARIVTEADGTVWLDVDVDPAMLGLDTCVVDTELLGTPRIVTEPFVNSDGTALAVDEDVNGEARGEHPVPGPLESLKPGSNRVRVA